MKADILKKYSSGRTPAIIWVYSSFGGALVAGISELYLHSDPDGRSWWQVCIRLIWTNLLFLIPMFCVQAHYVCKGLQKSIRKAKAIQGSVLTVGFFLMGFVNYYFTTRISVNRSESTQLLWINFFSIALTWVGMSIVSLRAEKQDSL